MIVTLCIGLIPSQYNIIQTPLTQFDTLPQSDIVASVSDALRDTVRIFSSETPPPHQLPPLATVVEESSRAATPLALAHAPNYVRDRIVLIGYEHIPFHS